MDFNGRRHESRATCEGSGSQLVISGYQGSVLTRHVYHHTLAMKELLFFLVIGVAATHAEDTVTELQVETIDKPSECKREARRGDMLSMHYRGSLTDGTEFDSRSDPTVCLLQVLKRLFFPAAGVGTSRSSSNWESGR